jgi:hypothetical protein
VALEIRIADLNQHLSLKDLVPPLPALPLLSLLPLPLLAVGLLGLYPSTSHSLHRNISMPTGMSVSIPGALLIVSVFELVAFARWPSFTDMAIGFLVYKGASTSRKF